MSTLYDRVLVELFRRHDGAECSEFEFTRDELAAILAEWGETIRNLSDITYSYRGGRRELPAEIAENGAWIIEGRGRGRYAFRRLARGPLLAFPEDLECTRVLDATPEIIRQYALDDEQSLLAVVRYNRLVDTFLGITAYHLQGHVRAYVSGQGQVELDDLYLGVDKNGRRYVIPVEAKTADESLGVVQATNLNAYATQAYPSLILRAVVIKAHADGSVYLAELTTATDPADIKVVDYRRYALVAGKNEAPRR